MTNDNCHGDIESMISSFKHRGLKRLYERGDAKWIAPEHRLKISDILTALENAQIIENMSFATFHLHQLSGSRKTTWSVTVRANWRITFIFEDGQAFDVNYEDYH